MDIIDIAIAKALAGGGGGGGSTPLIVTSYYDDGATFLDKTFGEIRQAFEAGRTVLLISDSSWETTLSVTLGNLSSVEYYVDEYSANGNVTFKSGGYSCAIPEAPYTLEALDAQYPYMGS